MYLFSASQGQGTSAWPWLERRADRVQAGDEVAVVAQHLERAGAHAGHDPHRHGHVGRVGDLHADVGDVRAERAHGERHHVHGPALHRAAEELGERLAHLGRVPPVVGGPGVDLVGRADEGPVLHPGHVARVGVGPVAVRPLGLGQPGEGALVHQQLAQPVVLLGRTVAPLDRVGGGERRHLLHPGDQLAIVGGGHGWLRFLLGHWLFELFGVTGHGHVRPPMVGMKPWRLPNPGRRSSAPVGTRMPPSSASPDALAGRLRAASDRGRSGSATTPPWWSAPPGRLVLATDAVVAGVHADLALVGPGRPGLEGLDRRRERHRRHGRPPAPRAGHPLRAARDRPGRPGQGVGRGVGRWRCPVVGGDLSSAGQVVVSVAVTGVLDGDLPPGHPGRRPTGGPLLVDRPAGRLGGRAATAPRRAGRAGGAGDREGAEVPSDTATALVEAHRRPRARLAEGRAARQAGATGHDRRLRRAGHRPAPPGRRLGGGVRLDEVPVAAGATARRRWAAARTTSWWWPPPTRTRLADRFAGPGCDRRWSSAAAPPTPASACWTGSRCPRWAGSTGRGVDRRGQPAGQPAEGTRRGGLVTLPARMHEVQTWRRRGDAVDQGPDPLDVGVPAALGAPVGVAEAHAERRLLAADLTYRCHRPTSS